MSDRTDVAYTAYNKECTTCGTEHVPIIEHWEKRNGTIYKVWELMDGTRIDFETPYTEIPVVQSPFHGKILEVMRESGYGMEVKVSNQCTTCGTEHDEEGYGWHDDGEDCLENPDNK